MRLLPAAGGAQDGEYEGRGGGGGGGQGRGGEGWGEAVGGGTGEQGGDKLVVTGYCK